MPTRILVPLAALLALSSCATQGVTPRPEPSAEPTPSPTSSPAPPDPAEVGANELGSVPVLMYHRIVAAPESVYDRTPKGFRAELERLAEEGYVPITAGQFTAGEIDVPAGAHPVVLTFDDADPSQFALTAAGEPKPGTAVAIMLEVAERHPEFRPVATFFVNADPFGDPGGRRTLPWLLEHGMEIGNHTATHANLGESTPDQVRREIAELDRLVRQAAPGAEPSTIALPFGIQPEPAELALRGEGYRYRGAFLVGANPAPSPYSAEFEPAGIPRIRSQGATGPEAQVCSTVWLDKLAASPTQRYTSDGMADRISFPRGSSEAVAASMRGRVLAY
ncbi:MAG TPA: polysaccharide deacetylase family protein [Actinophytocola sp.]|nr:polysaccharide deacetylase family protein [Actinophytocola sp.]